MSLDTLNQSMRTLAKMCLDLAIRLLLALLKSFSWYYSQLLLLLLLYSTPPSSQKEAIVKGGGGVERRLF